MLNGCRLILLTGIFIFLSACKEDYKTIQKFTVTPANREPKGDTIMHDNQGNFDFSRIVKKNEAGLTALINISEENRNKKIWVIFSGRLRTNYAHSNATISIAAIGLNQTIVVWNASFLKYFVTEINQWCPFKDSILLPREKLEQKYSMINTMAFLGNSENENFDVDTLKVEYRVEVTD
ncbi:MAG: hypothetical protein IPM51_08225 [Sphingobacteriaceae bacterium]|nr:hypothetical protein [Sphingobacteriaceae bacterium]